MPRNRVGVEVDSLPPAQKHEDEPHINSSYGSLGGSFPSTQLNSSASAPSLEAAKAQRQKELLRKKKAERRAHAKQRTAEKQQRQDEKKQKRELLAMMDEDFPAVDPPNVLVDTSTSTQPLACLEGERKDEDFSTKMHEATTSVPPLSYDADYPPITEMMPKNMKGSPLTKNANDAATTIQKALKKKFKKCKTMFRQSPRVFAEEAIDPTPQKEKAIEVAVICNDSAFDAKVAPKTRAHCASFGTISKSARNAASTWSQLKLFRIVFLFFFILFVLSKIWFCVFVLFWLVFLLELNFKSKLPISV
ncbi:hypothetical protein PR003_g13940 [Phytophthora rubi]|uniref:Uncharacterized protein n=1 Tax=Phytophthora rubi TaxID=129364 RepID=A0A6A3M2M1_9STRA|nr:hypothetical protein PR001_g13136 [Phytophthora rubi]KAE9333602.1 hypothetical protein PR003_g13940 [Phytophthora rubi]